ncbi:LysR family transcriptional regulator [Angustibacter luteus]|uniref:LysR family transcriptional regulator n=1 Tax=Angustibacter luteus TaxID=658456 RepID=A0ABW1JAK5_9ACTN
MLDVNALRVVRAIGDEGGFTAAANALGYSQPAVSQLVRRLERRLGTALVERHGRTVRLTEAGLVLARHAVTVQGALDTADEEIAAITGLRAGRVRVMAFPSSSASVVPRALADLRARHPGLSVTFSEGEPPQSLAALRSGECDVAVAFTYPGTSAGRDVDDLSGLLTVPLLDDELHVVLPADHPLADGERIGLPQLRDEPWIAGCPRCRGHLLSLADRAGFTPRVEFETDDYVAVLGLVSEGLGVALVPGLVLRTTTHQAVVTRPLHPTSRRSVLAVTTQDLRRVPAVHALIESLQRASR